ncbi:MAG: hypothetical protein V1833_00210 [Elusimicrobiota bacterium]
MTETDKLNSIFFDVLNDLKDYLDNLTLVGGWLPYVYINYLWDNVVAKPTTTVDIDFGLKKTDTKTYHKTIFDELLRLNYKEHYIEIGKLFPVILYKEGKIPIHFITSPETDKKSIEKFVGCQIYINIIDKFDFLLEHRISIDIKTKKGNYKIYCPKPSAFLYHKGATFIDREDEQKQAKDLYYMYFILRYAPDIKSIFKEVAQYRKKGYLKNISANLNKYFERETSKGCLMVEKENGDDEYIDNLRQDIFDRFKNLRELLSNIQ